MGLLEKLGLDRTKLMTDAVGSLPAPAGPKAAPPAPAGTDRDVAKAEADAALAPLAALAEGGIRDDKLRAKCKAELAPLTAASVAADRQKGDAAAIKGFKAVVVAAGKLHERAARWQAISDLLIDQWAPAVANAKTSIAAIGAARAKAALQAELTRLETAAKPKFAAASDPAGLEALVPALEGVQALAGRVAERGPEIDAELARVGGVITALGADAPAGLADRLAGLQREKKASWPDGKTLAAIEATLDAYDGELAAVASAADGTKKSRDAKATFEKDHAAAKADIEAAAALRSRHVAAMGAVLGVDFDNARKRVDDAVAADDWPKALAALPRLVRVSGEVRVAVDEEKKFQAAFARMRADVLKARAARDAATPLPDKIRVDFSDADNDVVAAMRHAQWAQATRLLPPLATTTAALLKVLADGKDFYAEIASTLPIRSAALSALSRLPLGSDRDNARIDLVTNEFWTLEGALEKAVNAGAWKDARKLVEGLRRAANDLVQAEKAYTADSKPFVDAFAKLKNLGVAEAAAEKPASAFAAEVQRFQAARKVVRDAEHAGRFAQALAALPALQTAIDVLLNAADANGDAKKAYDVAEAALKGRAEATAMAASPVQALGDEIAALRSAEAVLADARKRENWPAALNALPALQAAIDALLKSRAAINGGLGEASVAALNAKLAALKPRLDKANEAPVPKFVADLQKAALGKYADVERNLAEKDWATADANLVLLGQRLDAMEAGKARHAAHRAKVAQAKAGPLKAALATALTPPALATQRAQAMAAREAAIAALADEGKTVAADAAIPAWISEAQGWAESKEAFAELHDGGKPSVGDLEKLMKKPGGEAVMDRLIENMDPARTPGKVFAAALKARYGFEIKHMKTEKDEHDDERPDAEMQKIYALMKKIPSKRIKGKIKQIVDVDVDENRGLYQSNRKIYLYTNRPGHKGPGDQQEFGRVGEVVADGEKVDPACEPQNKDPVPEFDWVLLHEVAHAEDDGISFMDSRNGDPKFGDWRKEKPSSIAKVAAQHFGYDEDYLCDTLDDKQSKPPDKAPKARDGIDAKVWETRRVAAVTWCRQIRARNSPWDKGAVCKQIAIGGRVYQESYDDGTWYSYALAARAQGISGYQFRAPWEWFAELYAAHFSNKLKKEHPAMAWLTQFKPPEA